MAASRLRLVPLLTPFWAVLALASPGHASADSGPSLRFIGEATVPTGFMFQGTEVGGLSGIITIP